MALIISPVSGVTVAQGGTGVSTLADGGLVVGNATAAVEVVAAGATTEILVGGGALTNPIWTTATGTGAPVRAGTPSFTTGIGVGATAAGAGGIAFPATAVDVADANTLDDYEENSWTPELKFGGNATGLTTSLSTGFYTKIGRQVNIMGFIILTAKGSSTGIAEIYGLPFNVSASYINYIPVTLHLSTVTFADAPQAFLDTNLVQLQEITNAGTVTNLADTDFADTSRIRFSATYIV